MIRSKKKLNLFKMEQTIFNHKYMMTTNLKTITMILKMITKAPLIVPKKINKYLKTIF